MILYHFLNTEYGLEAIKNRRLKISRIMELNDPFEFLGAKIHKQDSRVALNKMKESIAKKNGILSFSKTWQNPVLWGHYADKNKGICLGFDVTKNYPIKINYVVSRLKIPKKLQSLFENPTYVSDLHWKDIIENRKGEEYQILFSFMEKILSTKFVHWKYEEEYRIWTPLEEEINGLYYVNFSDQLKLKRIIVGMP